MSWAKKMPHHRVKFEADGENRIVHESLFCSKEYSCISLTATLIEFDFE